MPPLAPLGPTDPLSRYQAELSRLRSISAELFEEQGPLAAQILVTLKVVPGLENR